jgi:hypothetical protein
LAFRLNDPLEKVDSALQLQRSSCVYRAAGAMPMGCEERLPQRHEHNLPQLQYRNHRNPPSHCKAVLLPQDAVTPSCLCAAGRCSTAPRSSSSKRPACARRWPPRNANSLLELHSAVCRSGEPVRLAALRAAGCARLLHRRQISRENPVCLQSCCPRSAC